MTRDQRDKHIARSLMVACAILLAETVWPGLRTAGLEVAQVAKQVEGAAQGSYSKLPTPPPPVKVPFRDERRTKIWRGNNLDALYRACAARAIDRNEVLCSIAPLPETIVTTTGGSGGGPGLTNEGSYITNRTNLLEPGGPPSGSGYGGYGSSTRFNTGTGNQTTGVSLTGWSCRGDLGVEANLFHNSKDDSTNCGLGIGWSHSYNIVAYYDSQLQKVVVQNSDGQTVPYTLTSGNWVPPAGFFDKLVQTSSGWKLTTKDQHEIHFTNYGSSGNAYVTAIKDRIGNTVTINRPSTGDPNQIIDVVDPDGSRKLTFNWSNNLLQSIVRSDGQTFTMEYTNGALTKVNFPNVGTYTNVYEAFTYDSNHNILTHTDRRGSTWTYTYDVNDRLETVTSPGSRPESERKTTFAFIGNEVVITLPLLDASAPTNVQTLKHTYDNGMLAQIKDAGDFTTLISYYTANNQVSYVRDANLYEWYFEYDGNGNLTKEDVPGPGDTWYEYNSTNDLTSVMTVRGQAAGNKKTVYAYKSNGLLESVTDPENKRLALVDSYDAYGQPNIVKDGLDRVTDYDYDGQGNLIKVTSPDGTHEDYEHTTFGRLKKATDAAGHYGELLYDSWDRPYKSLAEDASYAQIDVDPGGLVTSLRDQMAKVTTFAYDQTGQLLSRTSPRVDPVSLLHYTDTYEYDSHGSLVKWTNGRGKAVNYTRAARGELWKVTYPAGTSGQEVYRYLPTGELAQRKNGLNQAIDYLRNGVGGLTKVDYPAGTTDTTVTYDGDGNVATVADASGTTTWTRDLAGRTTQLAQPGGTVVTGYDAAGARVSSEEAGFGTSTWSYNSTNGRLDSKTNGYGETTSFHYDSYGRPDWTTFANNTKEVYGYDSLGRMGSLTLKNSSNSVLRSQSYAYRADGRISSHTLDGTATTFDYDEEGQLLSETKGSVTSSYTYDGNYNRLTKAVTGQPTETYSYDDADRLLSVTSSAGTKGFTYDNDGRCTSETWNSTVVKTYAWDPDGRMTSATGSWGTRSYAYNGFGARVAETGGAGRQWFRRNPTVTSPVIKDGINRYTPGTSLRDLAGGNSTFQHGGLLSLDSQTDSSQAVSATKSYDAFGATASSTGSWQGQSGFGGGFGYQPDSDTGLQLLGHRYYDPTTGRFLSRDPAKDGPNWYAYCLNDPVNGADPSGTVWIKTVVYKLFDGAGNFLKNGLTSRKLTVREREHIRRFGKGARAREVKIFEGEKPEKGKHLREALDYEYHLNTTEPGPYNFERYIKSNKAGLMLLLDIISIDPISAGEDLGEFIDPYVEDANRGLTDYRINRWLGEDDEYTTRL